jgi:hypothetical protein
MRIAFIVKSLRLREKPTLAAEALRRSDVGEAEFTMWRSIGDTISLADSMQIDKVGCYEIVRLRGAGAERREQPGN